MTEMFGRLARGMDDATRAEDRRDLKPDARGARWIRRHIADGVAALTTVIDGTYRATTITAYILTSIEPAQFLISIETGSQMADWLEQSGCFGLSILTRKQQFFADQFAGYAPVASTTFKGIKHFTVETGSPLLTQCIAWADCRVMTELETGDHRCFIGEVVALGVGEGNDLDPLVYYYNHYHGLER